MGAPALPSSARRKTPAPSRPVEKLRRVLLGERSFAVRLTLERRRAERSARVVGLMSVECPRGTSAAAAQAVMETLARSLRSTDVLGWQIQDEVPGAILTEFGSCLPAGALQAIEARLRPLLEGAAGGPCPRPIGMRFHLFPTKLPPEATGPAPDLSFYPELQPDQRLSGQRVLKRAMDVSGAAAALLLLGPLLGLIAAAVRLSSPGPAIYRQERIGHQGLPFVMYKFRTMRWLADPAIHRQFVERFIRGETDPSQPLHKISHDPRVTSLGRLLRRTSLDELPQLVNVLRGQMSLVGPRPPLAYEVRRYQPWHTRRVLEAKPGLTGLWQVTGRSKTRFDEMVRMDLRYARGQSLWLDVVLLCKTLRVLFSGEGAC